MRRSSLTLHITPDAAELTGPRGLARRASLQPLRTPEGDRLDDAAFGAILADWVQEHRLHGRRVVLVQELATGVCGAIACPKAAGHAAAIRAGVMALTEWGVDLDGHAPSDAVVAASDRCGDEGQIYVVTAWEADQECSDLCAIVESAGLRVAWTTSVSAAILVAAHRLAIEGSAEGPTVVLFIGDRSSVLCAADAGRVLLCREAGLGVEALIDALMHLTEQNDRSREDVRAGLFERGIPSIAGDGPEDPEARRTLAALQPVLQRWTVELRQSLRFAFPHRPPQQVALALQGHGGVVPGLAKYLADRVELNARVGPLAASRDATDSTLGAAAAVRAGMPSPRLLPARHRAARRSQSLRRAIWAGAAMAALVLGVDGYATFGQLREAQAATGALRAQVEGAAQALALHERTTDLERLASLAHARIERQLGGRTRFGASARAIAAATPSDILLEHASLSRAGDQTTCSITGYIGGPPGESAEALRKYSAALAALPIVARVQLGPAARSEMDGAEVRYFSLQLDLIPLPTRTEARAQ